MAERTIAEKFEVALSELISICLEAGMHTSEMAELLEAEAKWCRQPYQNAEDNEAEAKATKR